MIRVLQTLEPGEVTTYGDVATEAGYPGAARAVGNLLRTTPGLPWWRVVNAAGRLAPRSEQEQAQRLRAEGVTIGFKDLGAGGIACVSSEMADAGGFGIELDLAGGKVVITRIELDGRDIPDAAELPGRVEIFVNISSDKPRWRSLLSSEADFGDDGIAAFTFAPTWARQVRIAFGSNRGDADALSLGRIRISGP